jgi:hypothetical protein
MTGPLLAPDFALPEDLRAMIDKSVRDFEDQWGAMKALAKANGWLEKYRVEITRVVATAYQKGQENPPRPWGPWVNE